MKNRVDYNSISSHYNKRYAASPMQGIKEALTELINSYHPCTVLEVGCGTGRWLREFFERNIKVIGLDYSSGMLSEAAALNCAQLIRADANSIPLKENLFDIIYCVNAIHHFKNDAKFIQDIRRHLHKNGVLAIIGLEHHEEKMDWYIYDYFDGTLEFDKRRFTAFSKLKMMMVESGFNNIAIDIVDRVDVKRTGKEVFNDPFLEKDQSSQLAVLSEEEYTRGIDKMKQEIVENPNREFRIHFSVKMITGLATQVDVV